MSADIHVIEQLRDADEPIPYSTTEAWVLEDLRDRLNGAQRRLLATAAQYREDSIEVYPHDQHRSRGLKREAERLISKAEGLSLALDYLRAYPTNPED